MARTVGSAFVEAEGSLGREKPQRALYVVRQQSKLFAQQPGRQSLPRLVVVGADPVADGTVKGAVAGCGSRVRSRTGRLPVCSAISPRLSSRSSPWCTCFCGSAKARASCLVLGRRHPVGTRW